MKIILDSHYVWIKHLILFTLPFYAIKMRVLKAYTVLVTVPGTWNNLVNKPRIYAD